jgi:hypothetical protein
MRWFAWASVICVFLLLNTTVANAGCANCGGNDAGSYRAYCGPACFSPPGFCLAPGCCECPPSGCDNAWDGYCQEKARWQAFFARVGTPKVHCRYVNSIIPAEACATDKTIQPSAEPQPAPAAKPAAVPAGSAPTMSPGKATSKSNSRWFR